MIHFKIDGPFAEWESPTPTFTCEQGMTWAQWCASKYKDSRVYIDNNIVWAQDLQGGDVVYTDGDRPTGEVHVNDVIQPIETYGIFH